MSTDGTDVPSPSLDPVSSEELLLRLNFSTDHIQDGKVIPNAIAVEDLKKRGYSLDREVLADVSKISERAAAQSAKQPIGRQSAYISRFECGPVCKEIDEDGVTVFKVEASPLPDNSAHAHILSAISRGPGTLRKLRGQLVPHLNRQLMELREYAASKAKPETSPEQPRT